MKITISTPIAIALTCVATTAFTPGFGSTRAWAQAEPKDRCLVDIMRAGEVPNEAWSRAPVYDSAQSALDDGCIEIGLYCASQRGPCRHDGIDIQSLEERSLRSLEVDGIGGAVEIRGEEAPGVSIVDSRGILIEGIDTFRTEEATAAVYIEGSTVSLTGIRGRQPRYSQITAPQTIGLEIVRDSRVSTDLVAIVDSDLAVKMEDRFLFDPPTLESTGLVIKGNQEIARLSGGEDGCPARDGPLMTIDSDGGPSWTNYIVDNYKGVILDRSSRMEISHTVIAGNTRCPYPSCSRVEGSLFNVLRAASIGATNVAIYDNDEDPEIAFSSPSGRFSGIGNGYIVHMSSCSDVEFVASTIAWNAAEDTFSWTQQVPGIGQISFDHSLISHSGGKVLSRSGLGAPLCIDGTVSSVCSVMFANPVNSDPPSCDDMETFITTEPQDPEPYQASEAIELPRFPYVAGPYVPFLVHPGPYEPEPEVAEACIPRLIPDSTFPRSSEVYWSVSARPADEGHLDIGYHAPHLHTP